MDSLTPQQKPFSRQLQHSGQGDIVRGTAVSGAIAQTGPSQVKTAPRSDEQLSKSIPERTVAEKSIQSGALIQPVEPAKPTSLDEIRQCFAEKDYHQLCKLSVRKDNQQIIADSTPLVKAEMKFLNILANIRVTKQRPLVRLLQLTRELITYSRSILLIDENDEHQDERDKLLAYYSVVAYELTQSKYWHDSNDLQQLQALISGLSLLVIDRETAINLLKTAESETCADINFWLGITMLEQHPEQALIHLKKSWELNFKDARIWLGIAIFKVATREQVKADKRGAQHHKIFRAKMEELCRISSMAGQSVPLLMKADFIEQGRYGYEKDGEKAWQLVSEEYTRGSPYAALLKAVWITKAHCSLNVRRIQSRPVDGMNYLRIHDQRMDHHLYIISHFSPFVHLALGADRDGACLPEFSISQHKHNELARKMEYINTDNLELEDCDNPNTRENIFAKLLQARAVGSLIWMQAVKRAEESNLDDRQFQLFNSLESYFIDFPAQLTLLGLRWDGIHGSYLPGMTLYAFRQAIQNGAFSAAYASIRDLCIRRKDFVQAANISSVLCQRLPNGEPRYTLEPSDELINYQLNCVVQGSDDMDKLLDLVKNGSYNALILLARHSLQKGDFQKVRQLLQQTCTTEACLLRVAAKDELPLHLIPSYQDVLLEPKACFRALDLMHNDNYSLDNLNKADITPQELEPQLVLRFIWATTYKEIYMSLNDPGNAGVEKALSRFIQNKHYSDNKRLANIFLKLLTRDLSTLHQMAKNIVEHDLLSGAYALESLCARIISRDASFWKEKAEQQKPVLPCFYQWPEIEDRLLRDELTKPIVQDMRSAREKLIATGPSVLSRYVPDVYSKIEQALENTLGEENLSFVSQKVEVEQVYKELEPLMDTVLRTEEALSFDTEEEWQKTAAVRRYLFNMGMAQFRKNEPHAAILLITKAADLGFVPALKPAIVLLATTRGYTRAINLIKCYEISHKSPPLPDELIMWLKGWKQVLTQIECVFDPVLSYFNPGFHGESTYKRLLKKADQIADEVGDGYGYGALAHRIYKYLSLVSPLSQEHIIWRQRLYQLVMQAVYMKSPSALFCLPGYYDAARPDLLPIDLKMSFKIFRRVSCRLSSLSCYFYEFPETAPGLEMETRIKLVKPDSFAQAVLVSQVIKKLPHSCGMAYIASALNKDSEQMEVYKPHISSADQRIGEMALSFAKSDKKNTNTDHHLIEQIEMKLYQSATLSDKEKAVLKNELALLQLELVNRAMTKRINCELDWEELKQRVSVATNSKVSEAWFYKGLIARRTGRDKALKYYLKVVNDTTEQAWSAGAATCAAMIYLSRGEKGDRQSAMELLGHNIQMVHIPSLEIRLRQDAREGLKLEESEYWQLIQKSHFQIQYDMHLHTIKDISWNLDHLTPQKFQQTVEKVKDNNIMLVKYYCVVVLARGSDIHQKTLIEVFFNLINGLNHFNVLYLMDEPEMPVFLGLLNTMITLHPEKREQLRRLKQLLNPGEKREVLSPVQITAFDIESKYKHLFKKASSRNGTQEMMQELLTLTQYCPELVTADNCTTLSRQCLKSKAQGEELSGIYNRWLTLKLKSSGHSRQELLMDDMVWLCSFNSLNQQAFQYLLSALNETGQIVEQEKLRPSLILILHKLIASCDKRTDWIRLCSFYDYLASQAADVLRECSLEILILLFQRISDKNWKCPEQSLIPHLVDVLEARRVAHSLSSVELDQLCPAMLQHYQGHDSTSHSNRLNWITATSQDGGKSDIRRADTSLQKEINGLLLELGNGGSADLTRCQKMFQCIRNPRLYPFAHPMIVKAKNVSCTASGGWFEFIDTLPVSHGREFEQPLSYEALQRQLTMRQAGKSDIRCEIEELLTHHSARWLQEVKNKKSNLPDRLREETLRQLVDGSRERLNSLPVDVTRMLIDTLVKQNPTHRVLHHLLGHVDTTIWNTGFDTETLKQFTELLQADELRHQRRIHLQGIMQELGTRTEDQLQVLSTNQLIAVVVANSERQNVDELLCMLGRHMKRSASPGKQDTDTKALDGLTDVLAFQKPRSCRYMSTLLHCLSVVLEHRTVCQSTARKLITRLIEKIRSIDDQPDKKTRCMEQLKMCSAQLAGQKETLKGQRAIPELEKELQTFLRDTKSARCVHPGQRSKIEELRLRLLFWKDQPDSLLRQDFEQRIALLKFLDILDQNSSDDPPVGEGPRQAIMAASRTVEISLLSDHDRFRLECLSQTDDGWLDFCTHTKDRLSQRISNLKRLDQDLMPLIKDISYLPSSMLKPCAQQLHTHLKRVLPDVVKTVKQEIQQYSDDKASEALTRFRQVSEAVLVCDQICTWDDQLHPDLKTVCDGCEQLLADRRAALELVKQLQGVEEQLRQLEAMPSLSSRTIQQWQELFDKLEEIESPVIDNPVRARIMDCRKVLDFITRVQASDDTMTSIGLLEDFCFLHQTAEAKTLPLSAQNCNRLLLKRIPQAVGHLCGELLKHRPRQNNIFQALWLVSLWKQCEPGSPSCEDHIKKLAAAGLAFTTDEFEWQCYPRNVREIGERMLSSDFRDNPLAFQDHFAEWKESLEHVLRMGQAPDMNVLLCWIYILTDISNLVSGKSCETSRLGKRCNHRLKNVFTLAEPVRVAVLNLAKWVKEFRKYKAASVVQNKWLPIEGVCQRLENLKEIRNMPEDNQVVARELYRQIRERADHNQREKARMDLQELFEAESERIIVQGTQVVLLNPNVVNKGQRLGKEKR